MKKYAFILIALIFGIIAVANYQNLKDFYYFKRATFKLDSAYQNEVQTLKAAKEKCVFEVGDLSDPNALIAHAAGAIIIDDTTYTYTNSKEALLTSIKTGYMFIELDLMLDSSGDIFGAHDYEHFYNITNAPKDTPISQPPSKDYITKTPKYTINSPHSLKILSMRFF